MSTRIRTWARARRVVLTIRHGDVFLIIELGADTARALSDDLAWAEDLVSHKPDHLPQWHEISFPETKP